MVLRQSNRPALCDFSRRHIFVHLTVIKSLLYLKRATDTFLKIPCSIPKAYTVLSGRVEVIGEFKGVARIQFFGFHEVFWEKWSNNRLAPQSLRLAPPPVLEILNPPLQVNHMNQAWETKHEWLSKDKNNKTYKGTKKYRVESAEKKSESVKQFLSIDILQGSFLYF